MQLDRRTLLRGALALGVGTLAAACTPDGGTPPIPAGTTSRSPAAAGTGARTVPRELAPIPEGFSAPAAQQGALVELTYDTYESTTYEQATQKLTKRAIVYLPDGYDATRQYNVFYLMHGGWSNETTTLGTPGNPSPFKNVLDNAIATGTIPPLIVVCPTYNNTRASDSADFGLALQLNQNYHHELLNDLIPAVEGKYSSYADSITPDRLIAARDHRGFGGFSMGAVATWRTFQHGLDYFRYFLPMSCGTSLDMDTIVAPAAARDRSDYYVWVITGTDDFALPYDQARVEYLRDSPSFTEADEAQDGNFAFHAKDGYAHDGIAATHYTYNGLTWFWNPRHQRPAAHPLRPLAPSANPRPG